MAVRGKSRLAVWTCAALGALALPPAAQAQSQFTRIQAFGDSYVDNGNLFRIIGTPFPPAYPTGRFSGGTNFVDTTSALLGIPQLNYAIGGATAGPTNVVGPGIPGFQQEWQAFVGGGQTFAPTDLVIVNIGGNDARGYYQSGGTAAGATAAATVSANQAITGVNALVGAGARTIVFGLGDVSGLPEAVLNPAGAAVGSAFSQAYNAQTQAALASIARSGVRVEAVNIFTLGNLIQANPGRYGIQNVGACPLACIGNPALQSQYLFYFDGVHLTSRGFEILGQYTVNRLNAPLTFASQGDVAFNTMMGFASNLYGRLDSFRETSASAPANAYASASRVPYTKAPPLAAVPYNPWSFYMQANGAISDRGATNASTGYRLDSVGGTIGTEYRIAPNAFVGAAFDYANPKARLSNSAGTTEADSYQFGLYGAWNGTNFFAQALATVGRQDFTLSRPGVVDMITAAPSGNTFTIGGKTGYLFDAGSVRVGPIGGLTYARARINGYTEAGDPVLTLGVNGQTAELLVGSVGAQLRLPFWVNGRTISPYINLTADSDLIGNGRFVNYSATSAPLIVNAFTLPGRSHDIYGRVATGVAAPITANVAFTANLSRSFGRSGGDDFFANGGLKVSF